MCIIYIPFLVKIYESVLNLFNGICLYLADVHGTL